MKKRVLFVLLSFLCFASCEEKIDWNISPQISDRIVIESILTNEIKQQEVRLTTVSASLHEPGLPVSGAQVLVTSPDQIFVFKESVLHPGLYYSEELFSIDTGEIYDLEVNTGSKVFSASTLSIPDAPMKAFTFVPYQKSDSLFIANIGVEYSEKEQVMYTIDIDWTDILPGEKSKAKVFHYVFNSVNIGQLFGPDLSVLLFPKGSTVTIKKYTLESGFAEYLRTLIIETRWKGGFFEETPGNLPSNISNNALGYFAVCNVETVSLIAK